MIHITIQTPLGNSWRCRVLQKLSEKRAGAQPMLERKCSLQGKQRAEERSFCHSLLASVQCWSSLEGAKVQMEGEFKLKGSIGRGKDEEEEAGSKAEWVSATLRARKGS